MQKPKRSRATMQQSALKLPLARIPPARLPVFAPQKLMREITRASGIGYDGRRVVFQSFVRALRPKPATLSRREKTAVSYMREKFGKNFFERKGAMAVLFREWARVMKKATDNGYRSLTLGEAALANAFMAACRNYQRNKLQKQMKK